MKMTYHTRPIWPKLPDSRLLSSWRARDCNHFPLDNLGANPFPIYPYYWDHKIGKQETTRWKSHLKLLFSGGSIDQTEALRGEKHFLGERPPPPPPFGPFFQGLDLALLLTNVFNISSSRFLRFSRLIYPIYFKRKTQDLIFLHYIQFFCKLIQIEG